MKNNKSIKYILLLFMAMAALLIGCSKPQEAVTDTYQVTEEDLSYALPKIGEAEIIKAEVKAGSRGTISVATVGSPNTEILKEAANILAEEGYLLNIEVCEDYLTPNQLVTEGKVDCNYYQHAAFLERYNIEKQTNLIEMAKIHYEPMAIFGNKLESLETVEKGAKVILPENPTALAQALWLLQAEGLLTLMSDADMNTVIDDIAQNPYELEFVSMAEEEILKNLDEADFVLCHTGYTLKEGMDADSILLTMENKDSMMAKKLAQSVIVSAYPNEKASILIEVLMSEKMQKFVETQYQGSIYIMDGELSDIAVTENETADLEETEMENEGE